jgi:hypothetical protein
MKSNKKIGGKWSLKYKRSINCKHPKGFSQKQHCKYGRTHKKQKGGVKSGYTIVGFTGRPMNNSTTGPNAATQFTGRMVGTIPICLPDHEILGSLYSRMGQIGIGGQFIILPQLYKLEWVHGKINMYDMLRNEIILCDKNEKNYFEKVGSSLPPTDQVKLNEWLSQSDTWDESTRTFTGKTRKDIIIEIEKEYPGLFIPIFVDDGRYHYVHNDLFVNEI